MLIPNDSPLRAIADETARLVHLGHKFDAARCVAEGCKLGVRLNDDDPKKYIPVLLNWWHGLMNYGFPGDAAKLLWNPNLFTPDPKYTQDSWRCFDQNQLGLVLGGASCGKSFGIGVRIFMEWVRDPNNTAVRVIGPSEDHLNANLFSHLVRLHKNSSIPLPGTIGELFIGTDRREMGGAISGTIIPLGRAHKAGRVQGTKRVPRVDCHPIFGPLTRLIIFIDEFENVPLGIWHDIDNVISQCGSPPEMMDFRLWGAYNPSDINHEVAKRAEPEFGWKDFNPEEHYEWMSKRGWKCLRLDPEKCENVVAGKIIYPGLQTREGLAQLAKNSGGHSSPGYMTMGRGCYPSSGVTTSAIPPGLFEKSRAEFVWHDEPARVGSVDNALEGNAAPILSLGVLGMADGIKYPPSLNFPDGHVVPFKDRNGVHIQRWGLQLDSQHQLESGDTVKMAASIIDGWRRAGVAPQLAAMDRTGNGAGIADLVKNDWSTLIQDLNYSEGATEERVFIEDKLAPKEQYERAASQLWFLTRGWLEFSYFLINPKMDCSKLKEQLTTRLFTSRGAKTRIETKKDYKGRGFTSPDEADSVTLLVWAAFKHVGTLSMRLDEPSIGPNSMDEGWTHAAGYPGQRAIDPSNRSDFLDTSA